MISEDKIAAATVAQIFGSELLRVDQATTSSEGQLMPATRIDPKKILLSGSNEFSSKQKEAERRMIEALQREAEMAHPIPPQVQQSVDQSAENLNTNVERPSNRQQEVLIDHVVNAVADLETKEHLKSISESLRKIADHICSANEQTAATPRKRSLFTK